MPLQQSITLPTPTKWLHHAPLEIPMIHGHPPKWTENEEVLCHLKDDAKPPLHQN